MTHSAADLRRRFRRSRRALTAQHQAQHADAVARALASSGLLNRTSRCGLYFSKSEDGELDTLPLLARLWSMGKTVACPVVGRRGTMDFYQVTPVTALNANRYGIPEPATRGSRSAKFINPRSLDVLFLPLVAFDDSGSRLGMGAGYYDRYLGSLLPAHRPLTVGIAHDCQRSKVPLTRESWDIPLDAVTTESGWQPFTPRAKVG